MNSKQEVQDFDSFDDSELMYWQIARRYQCEKCNRKFVQVCKKTDPIQDITCCGQCCERYLDGAPDFMMNNITTVGQQGEKNWKAMGRYKRSEIEEAEKPNREARDRKAKTKKLASMNPEQQKRYILEGKM